MTIYFLVITQQTGFLQPKSPQILCIYKYSELFVLNCRNPHITGIAPETGMIIKKIHRTNLAKPSVFKAFTGLSYYIVPIQAVAAKELTCFRDILFRVIQHMCRYTMRSGRFHRYLYLFLYIFHFIMQHPCDLDKMRHFFNHPACKKRSCRKLVLSTASFTLSAFDFSFKSNFFQELDALAIVLFRHLFAEFNGDLFRIDALKSLCIKFGRLCIFYNDCS